MTFSPDPNPELSREQTNKLKDIGNDLKTSKSILLAVSFSETLHDREIRYHFKHQSTFIHFQEK